MLLCFSLQIVLSRDAPILVFGLDTMLKCSDTVKKCDCIDAFLEFSRISLVMLRCLNHLSGFIHSDVLMGKTLLEREDMSERVLKLLVVSASAPFLPPDALMISCGFDVIFSEVNRFLNIHPFKSTFEMYLTISAHHRYQPKKIKYRCIRSFKNIQSFTNPPKIITTIMSRLRLKCYINIII